MAAIKFCIQIIAVFSLLLLINSKDVSTQSNYDVIRMNYLSGEFKIDFENKIVHGNLTYNLTAESNGDQIIFDTNKLNVKNVNKIDKETTEPLKYSLEDGEEYLGKKLIINLNFVQNDDVQIKIEYETTPDGDSAQFLSPNQTFGGNYPYFFTISEMILGRSLFPCQDTPAVKFKFDLKIIVPKDLKGMISGIFVNDENYDDAHKAFNYKQDIPVPSYLVSLAAGNIKEKNISDVISIYSEPEYLDAAYNEAREDIPKVLELAINYTGPYKWGKLNLLVLPKSFPYSGIENPNLIFLSPCVINGDKSLIDIMVHMIMHQWAGNLVTQENWSDFWINAGIALFLRRKVMGLLKNDTELVRMDGYQGMYYIEYYIKYFKEDNKDFTSLHPNLQGKNPQDYFIDIPYEKGYNFIYYIESLIGQDLMEQFFKEYFSHFENKSIDCEQFKNYFIEYCKDKVSKETLDKINWEKWIQTPGEIAEVISEENKYKNQTDKIFAKIIDENFEGLEEEFNNLPTISKVYIFSMFSYGEKYYLTEKQHKFFTETLKLYENQNFLTTVNYLYMILQKSDKFLDHELDCLNNILSNYSVIDYLSGLYPEFYKRDEIKAMEILEQNKEFYHPLMYNMALEEIEEAKNEFPILELNVSADTFNLPLDNIVLNVSEYKNTLGEIELNDNIYLVSENEQHELICFIKSADIQYCKLKNLTSFKSSGNYHIKVAERIQKRNYAIKVFESKTFIVNQLLDIEKIDKIYYFDFKEKNISNINLYFVKDTFDKVDNIVAIFEKNNEIKLDYKRNDNTFSFIYDLNKPLIESKYRIYKEYTKFQVNFLSKNNESFLDIDVYIKNSENGDESEEITDVSTLSNYKQISIQHISGEFKTDFEKKIINGSLCYNLTAKEDGNQIIFDTSALKIYNIYQVNDNTENNIEFNFGNKDEQLGQPLIMNVNFKKNDYITIKIDFCTTEESIAVKFLTSNQTFGQNQPYMFTQSKLILGRSLFPCQDTPAIKFKFNLKIIVPKDLKGMISGIFVNEEDYSDTNYKSFNYKLDIPIPSYLLALAAGNITEKSINENISVYSEPDFVDKAYNEVYENISKVIELTENYTGQKYEWGKYSILVLPKSFPYSGTENPCLTFLSSSLINGDKELVDNIFHEMIHSWSGNLVTNEAWSDFWLNEGITTFLTRKVLSILTNDKELTRMDGLNGQYFIKESVNFFGDENKEYTKLRPNLTGVSPDDVYSDIPFEKGYNFIYYLEKLIGEEKMEKFFKSYFENFKYQSVNYFHFKNHFIKFCKNHDISDEILQKINWTAWIFTPGDLPEEIKEENRYKEKAEAILDKIKKEELDNLATEFQNLEVSSKLYILIILCGEDSLLTEKQHKFFTETLKLYEKQNFLMTTYYFKLILQKTTNFLEHELESLLKYLENNAAQDYMFGVYGAFYKRDEVKAVETLENSKSFYHALMYNMAKDDIETAKNEFPIMEINVNKDKKYYYPYEDVFDLDVEKYKDELGQINLDKNIYLVLDEQTKLELNCTIKNTNSKQCKLNDIKSLETSGQYSIKVTERVQELKYAIKVFESNKFEIRQFLDRNKTKNSYTYDFSKEESLKIVLNLNEAINFDLPVYFNNQEELKLKCALNNTGYECEINKTFCETNCKVDATGKNYKLNILSKSKESFFDIDVLIKNTTSSEDNPTGSGNNTLAIVLPCVIVGVLIIGVIIFFVYRRKRQTLTTDEVSKELVSVGFRDDEN